MLRDRSAFLGARGLLPYRGIESPEPPFVLAPAWRHVPRGTVGPGAPLPLFLLGTE